MRRAIRCLSILVLVWSLTGLAEPRIAVIIHPNSAFAELTRKQILDIYMGRLLNLPNNTIPLPFDLQATSPLREQFYEKLAERPLAQINAYWARLMFSGRATPPRMLPDPLGMLQVVSQNRDAIGYVREDMINASVRVLFYLE